MFVLVALDLVGPLVIRRLINLVEDPSRGQAALTGVAQLALLYLGVSALRGFFEFVSSYMGHVAGWGVVADTRRLVYQHVQRLSLRFYEDQKTGDLMSRVINDTNLFEAIIAHAVPNTLVNILTLIGVSAILTTLNWRLMLLTLIPVPFVVLAMRAFAKYVRPAFRDRQTVLSELNASINDNLSGIREIKAFSREESEAARIGRDIDRYRDSLLRALRLMATFNPFVQFSSQLGYIIVIYFGGKLAFDGVLPVADLVAFFLYLERFYAPVRGLAGSWEQLQEALAGADRVAELLEQEPEVAETPGAVALPARAGGHIEFNNVTFGYNSDDPVLRNVNLDVQAGTVVALVGPTGVGKTTLVSLVPRFYDVIQGTVTLDGINLRDITLKSLREQISIVLQDVFLFHGTVKENILFGRPDASDAEVIQAAKIANAHDFIMNDLSDGYDTVIGERGVKLSGGQKQRISIARAVLKDAPILILDEATSSVDTETELLIQQALERLAEGRTTLIIAHRLSTIRDADMIVVLANDGIAEMGNHFELMAQDGLYRHLSEVQTRISNGDVAGTEAGDRRTA
ncbi:MAG: ABC transporter ATP-binding protein [Anaerolineae bacterium]|nr:ABC transporter ATP-binding protein [Anaerolineae bacterium]